MGLFDALGISGSGLSAQRLRMDVTAENLANAQTTSDHKHEIGKTGHPATTEWTVLGFFSLGEPGVPSLFPDLSTVFAGTSSVTIAKSGLIKTTTTSPTRTSPSCAGSSSGFNNMPTDTNASHWPVTFR